MLGVFLLKIIVPKKYDILLINKHWPRLQWMGLHNKLSFNNNCLVLRWKTLIVNCIIEKKNVIMKATNRRCSIFRCIPFFFFTRFCYVLFFLVRLKSSTVLAITSVRTPPSAPVSSRAIVEKAWRRQYSLIVTYKSFHKRRWILSVIKSINAFKGN